MVNSSYTPKKNMESAFQAQEGTGVNGRERLAPIIPTLCEAENIRSVLNRVRSVLDPLGISYEILVVDDDSSEGAFAFRGLPLRGRQPPAGAATESTAEQRASSPTLRGPERTRPL